MVNDVTIQVNETTDVDDEDFLTSSGSGDTSTSIDTTLGLNGDLDDAKSEPLSTLTITIMAAVFAALLVSLLIVGFVYWKRRLKKTLTRETEMTTLRSLSSPSQGSSSNTVLPTVSIDNKGRPQCDNKTAKGLTHRGNVHNESNWTQLQTTEVHLYEKIA